MSALPAAGRDEQVGTLVDLVRIPSVVGTAAEVGIVRHVADLLDGFEVDLWPIPVADLVARPDFPGMEVTRREAWGLVARLPGVGGGRSLMLNGHLDVVPPGDPGAWSDDPYSGRLVDGHVYGRGACDMKGGVVAALAAIRALRDGGVRLAGDVLFAAVVGEEDGGLGTYAALHRGMQALETDAPRLRQPSLRLLAREVGVRPGQIHRPRHHPDNGGLKIPRQQRQQFMPDAIARMAGGGIARIFPETDAVFSSVPLQVHFAEFEEGTHEPYRRGS